MTVRDKVKYMQFNAIQAFRNLEPETKPIFGKMNAQQVIEHLTGAVKIAYGAIPVKVLYEGEEAEKRYRWLMDPTTSFKENSKNELLPDEPLPTKSPSIGDAIDDLEDALAAFLNFYKEDKSMKVQNSFFGELDYYEQATLLYKHFCHHLRQFGVK
jgi:hydroxymethylglutaryl-CoA reductase